MKKLLLIVSIIISFLVSGCSAINSQKDIVKNSNAIVSSASNSTTVLETELTNAVIESETNSTIEKEMAVRTTKLTAKSNSTTTKVTTTKRVTTTKKITTTEAPYFCDEGGTHHSCSVGPIGWVNSFDEAVDASLEYISDHDTSGNFRVKECFYCGKYTAEVTLD